MARTIQSSRPKEDASSNDAINRRLLTDRARTMCRLGIISGVFITILGASGLLILLGMIFQFPLQQQGGPGRR